MILEHGIIEPGKRIGNLFIGSRRDEVLDRLCAPDGVEEISKGILLYTWKNFKLWFSEDEKLYQIGVTKGFLGQYKGIGIGSNLKNVEDTFGSFLERYDEYEIPGVSGICFELEDVDDWNEMTAPIEWIFVYKY